MNLVNVHVILQVAPYVRNNFLTHAFFQESRIIFLGKPDKKLCIYHDKCQHNSTSCLSLSSKDKP